MIRQKIYKEKIQKLFFKIVLKHSNCEQTSENFKNSKKVLKV